MATRMTLTAIYTQVEAGWTQARITEIPAVITVAPTPQEAKEMLIDALREFLLSLGESNGDDSGPGAGSTTAPLDVLLDA